MAETLNERTSQELESFDGSELVLHLQSFEGPLDLLLYLIRQKDLDIFDIPIYQIAEEFDKYVELMRKLNLDRAGEYLNMAAELAQIKAKLLLPKDEDKPEEDPRRPLVERLLAYREFQKVSAALAQLPQLGFQVFKRGTDPTELIPPPQLQPMEGESQQLLSIFQKLLKKRFQTQKVHTLRREEVTVRERLFWLVDLLKEKGQISLSDLLNMMHSKAVIVASFLALLELCRLGYATVSVREDDALVESTDKIESFSLQGETQFDPEVLQYER